MSDPASVVPLTVNQVNHCLQALFSTNVFGKVLFVLKDPTIELRNHLEYDVNWKLWWSNAASIAVVYLQHFKHQPHLLTSESNLLNSTGHFVTIVKCKDSKTVCVLDSLNLSTSVLTEYFPGWNDFALDCKRHGPTLSAPNFQSSQKFAEDEWSTCGYWSVMFAFFLARSKEPLNSQTVYSLSFMSPSLNRPSHLKNMRHMMTAQMLMYFSEIFGRI